jgi:hypothetical protein
VFPAHGGRLNVGVMHYPATPLSGADIVDRLRTGLGDHGLSLDDGLARGWPAWSYRPSTPVAAPHLLTLGDAAGIDASLCGWIEEHPTLLLERDAIAAIGALRGRGSPILALDERGAIVVVQRLYSDDAPAAIGEALAEAARIDEMPFAELDALARRLDRTAGRGLRAIYRDAFLAGRPDAERALERIAFNARQRVVFVATAFTMQC